MLKQLNSQLLELRQIFQQATILIGAIVNLYFPNSFLSLSLQKILVSHHRLEVKILLHCARPFLDASAEVQMQTALQQPLD